MPTFNFNKIIRVLILSDMLTFSAWGLIGPVLAVFVLRNIEGGDASVAGLAVGIYWITKSLLQIPIGKYLDRRIGERDDYWFVVAGTFIASLTPLLYLASSEPWHIYGLEILHAAAMAMAIPAWAGIFTRHIDKGREAETWGFESSSLGLGVGIAGIVGGFIAEIAGFTYLFVGVSVFGMAGSGLLLFMKEDILKKSRMGARDAQHLRDARHARMREIKKVGM